MGVLTGTVYQRVDSYQKQLISVPGLFTALSIWILTFIVESMLNVRPEAVIIAPGLLLGLYFMFAIKVASQWQKAVVLRFGRFIGMRGPGMFFIVPVVDSV